MTEKVTETIMVEDFAPAKEKMRKDVLRGLSDDPKRLPSQYLYDERGAKLFEKICETDEYYLTRTEIAILESNIDSIRKRIGPAALVIEPGSGSGVKTRLLLENLDEPAGYVPIDVSKRQLLEFSEDVRRQFPQLEVTPVCADFTQDYEIPECDLPARKRVAFFPGSTIGNFTPDTAIDVLRHLAQLAGDDGGVLVGVDLKKDPAVIEAAYDDAQGVSRNFALNYLVRLNRELGADFQLADFDYEAPYEETHGRIEMALVSRRRQTARIDGVKVAFDPAERIGTEFSYKYDPAGFADLADKAGLRVAQVWTDPDELFSVQYLSTDGRNES